VQLQDLQEGLTVLALPQSYFGQLPVAVMIGQKVELESSTLTP